MITKEPKTMRQPLMFMSSHRKWFALAIFLLVTGIALRHYATGGGPTGSPEICGYCPMGAIASLYVFVVHGQFLRHIQPISLIVLVAVLLVTLLSRRAFCGWICPFGTLQEWLARAGRKLSGKKLEPPVWLDRKLRYLKYAVLVVVVAASWSIGTLVFRKYDPYLATFDFGASWNELWPGYIILGCVVLGALFIERIWCRYACPLGALLGLAGKIGIMKIIHQEGICTSCKAGVQRCPVGIDPTRISDLRSAECLQCMECVAACPLHNAVHVEAFGRPMRPAMVGVSIVGAFLLVIVASQYLGAWQSIHGRDRGRSFWSLSDIEERMVTGSMTLAGVAEMYQLEIQALRGLLGIPPGTPMHAQINELRQANPGSIPSPEEMEAILGGAETAVSSGSGSPRSRRATAPGDGSGFKQSARPRRGGGGRSPAGSKQQLRGSTTLQQALKLSGKTLDQVKEDWDLTFVDPQQNLGALARMIGIPMRELREYFQR